MKARERLVSVLLALVGVAALVLKPLYGGPLADAVYSYGGNFAVSFALYFVAKLPLSQYAHGRAASALAALVAVELFEATDGFGVMANVYDRGDFAANAAGVAFGLLVDLALSRAFETHDEQA